MLVFDELKSGRMSLDQDLTVSRRAAGMPPVRLGLTAGSKIKLRDAIAIAAVRSSNDIAVVLAEAVAGSEAAFAAMMTAKARDLGMNNTTFQNATGLPNSQQLITARDMATLSRHLIQEYPDHYHYFSLRSYRYNGRTLRNTNGLLGAYAGMDGIKTGYTCASGFNLAASATRSGKRIVAVTIGHPSVAHRNAEMRRLLDRGFTAQARLPATMPDTMPIPLLRPRPTS